MAKMLNLMPGKPSEGLPICKKRRYFQHLLSDNHDKVITAIGDYLCFFERHNYSDIGPDDCMALDDFVSTVFTILTDQNFKVSERGALMCASTGHLFSNLVATSSYKTTDAALLHVLRQKNNFAKLLFLYNARCSCDIPVAKLFDVNPSLASIWYTTFVLGASNPTAIIQRNLLRHLEAMDERWVPPNHKVSVLYFTTTYFAPHEDQRVKGIMNRACKEKIKLRVKNVDTDPKHIAIITAKWHRNHAVYKSASPLVDQLREKYKLSLIHLGDHRPPNLVTEGFDKVYDVMFKGTNIVLPPEVQSNDFQALYYPDIGMNDENLWMSNARVAPIQVMGYGHPATSGEDSEIDYFIGGTCEREVYDRYSEQMVLIPGLAQHPAWPQYERKNNWEPGEVVNINCIWGPDKYNYTMLAGLQKISSRCKTPHVWHFFPSPGINRYAALLPFKRDILQILPNSIVHSDKEYYEYMEAAEKHDMAVNSYPFGGYNTVIESLYLGTPIATLEGDRYYNRAASYLLREIGMDALSSTDPEHFLNIVVRMIEDADHRQALRDKLATINLREKLFYDPGTYFLQAFDYIIENHPIKSDGPIFIGE